MKKKSKELIKTMTFPEASHYCDEHPQWKIPNILEAQELEPTEHNQFWISDSMHWLTFVYDKKKQCLIVQHPQFRNNVVLVRSDNDID
jgi:hypothetical protein